MAFLLFDIGGTNMRLALLGDGKSFDLPAQVLQGKIWEGGPKIVPTPEDFDEGIKKFKEIAGELAGGNKIDAVAGGIASPLDKNKEIINPPNLPSWQGKNFKKELENLFGAPVYLENDAALGALGEAIYGAGKSYNIVAYIAVGTGVGGARIVDGGIDQSAHGFEPGHQIINKEKTLEEFIGGAYLKKKHGKSPSDIKDADIRDEIEKNLALGLNNIIVLWSPDVIVLGGGQMNNINIDNVQKHLQKTLKIFPQAPEIKKAELGDKAGLYGALALMAQKQE